MRSRMKRKKWSEVEEETLLSKYAELQNSGTLPKLRTREKKFKPIADHLNSVHHLQDPSRFPFKWSWRDVSIKVQNMRHQYLGVKQKIRVSDNEFNWEDGDNHWENFNKYKDVFGDVHLEINNNNGEFSSNVDELFGRSGGEDDLGLGLGFQMIDCDEEEQGFELLNDENRRKAETLIVKSLAMDEERLELEELEMRLSKREFDRKLWLERELDDERRWRIKMEEKREDEEMEWRERMLSLQLDHQKQIMQMHADACHNQMHIIGIMTRFMSQFFGTAADTLGGGLGGMHSQVLQTLHHPGPAGLGLNHKPGSDSPPHYI